MKFLGLKDVSVGLKRTVSTRAEEFQEYVVYIFERILGYCVS